MTARYSFIGNVFVKGDYLQFVGMSFDTIFEITEGFVRSHFESVERLHKIEIDTGQDFT